MAINLDFGSLEGDFGGSLEDSTDDIEDSVCNICSEKYSDPRIISCLHVYCGPCIDNLSTQNHGVLQCPDCLQETKVSIINKITW